MIAAMTEKGSINPQVKSDGKKDSDSDRLQFLAPDRTGFARLRVSLVGRRVGRPFRRVLMINGIDSKTL